jgi:uncharacterized protein (TIGR03790 family)
VPAGFPLYVQGGGSGLNVAIVVNQKSTNSIQLGNYYREQRQIPPQNFLRINWPGNNTDWTATDFTNYLLNPVLSTLTSRGLTNQIDFIVLSMDIPYQVTVPSLDVNSTTSTLFYGFKSAPPPGNCNIAIDSTNTYAFSEGVFRSILPFGPNNNSWMVMMITSSNLALAKQAVDQGVRSDSTFPTQTVYLGKTTDVFRNVRFVLFDNAIFNTRLRGNYSMQRTNFNLIFGYTNMLGFECGAYFFDTSTFGYVPGAIVDNLTSYGGLLFQNSSGAITIPYFLAEGAAASYGTVTEPCNFLEKFPSPMDYFYQSRGFSIAESYYQSVLCPYNGHFIGEPLAAPFAKPANGSWNNLPSGALLSGTTNLSLQFNASDTNHPVQQVDLFVDGALSQTLTNIPPGPNNILYVTLNGVRTNYTVPSGATLQSVASNLTTQLNRSSYANLTKVQAFAYGDRVELQSTDITRSGSQVSLSVSNSIGSGTRLTTFITASAAPFVDTIAYGLRSYEVDNELAFPLTIRVPPPTLSWPGTFGGNYDILTTTNLALPFQSNVTVTSTGAPTIWVDTNLPAGQRFYRVRTSGSFLSLQVLKTNGTVVTLTANYPADGTNVSLLTQSLVNMVNSNSVLQASDGIAAEDFFGYDPYGLAAATFNLRALSPGWNASQISVTLSGSFSFAITPTGTHFLDDNLSDLEPRAHLYITAGTTSLPLTFPLNTTVLADGYHDLTAVVYEGSNVRTETLITQTVCVTNNPLYASFTPLFGGTNADVHAILQFSVVANTSGISKIELFSTGGSLTNVTGQSSVTFAVPGTNLDVGLHPFYAVVSATSGKQYRTQTKWIRLTTAGSAVLLNN